ncbi:ribbon-helix-helix domain-containing protein [Mesorhizobium sp. IMUNJ 23232]|uniref:ribbon-helix-helix domain-containing protein n=1 Tax=Mesorhizobium sp. IMUNJ 23232 TaxID=3376064 RepID=UPI0037AF3393
MSLVRKHSVSIRGHRTSYSLEQPFFDELARIASLRGLPLAALIAEIDEGRPREANLSSAIRVHVLDWVKSERANLEVKATASQPFKPALPTQVP